MNALETINGYRNNAVIMSFVNKEAAEKTASDIREKTKSSTTAKAVELMVANKNEVVTTRFNEYVAAGLIGCYIASQK